MIVYGHIDGRKVGRSAGKLQARPPEQALRPWQGWRRQVCLPAAAWTASKFPRLQGHFLQERSIAFAQLRTVMNYSTHCAYIHFNYELMVVLLLLLLPSRGLTSER